MEDALQAGRVGQPLRDEVLHLDGHALARARGGAAGRRAGPPLHPPRPPGRSPPGGAPRPPPPKTRRHSARPSRVPTDVSKEPGPPAQAYKPQPEAYLHTAEVLGLPPAACMMVAAHNGDLRAARGVGFATAFVARPREHGPGQTTNLAPEEAGDVVARDFVALADLLTA